MKITVLGCGTSGGVPIIGNYWGDCDPANPKNRRRRVSIAVEEGDTRVIVDTSPDLREQFLDNQIDTVDAVLYTHDHADHTHGIDDLRIVAYRRRGRVPVYGNKETINTLLERFKYIFYAQEGYPAICEQKLIDGPLDIGDLHVIPFNQNHGTMTTLGFRFGDFAYSTDVNSLDDQAFKALEGVKVWLVDALRYEPHPTHSHLKQTLEWIKRVQPERAYLTHMTWDMDYETLRVQLPEGIEPAYDGLTITL